MRPCQGVWLGFDRRLRTTAGLVVTILALAVLTGVQADEPEPSLLRDSTTARARPIRETAEPRNAQWVEIRKRRVGASSPTLRWQSGVSSPVQPAAHVEAEPVKPIQVANKVLTWGRDADAKSPRVRLVTQLGPIDPFDDPFGDRGGVFEAPNNRTATSQGEVQPLPDLTPRPAAPQSEPDFSPFREETPRPAPLDDLVPQPDPFGDERMPPPPESDDRVFSDPATPGQPYRRADCDKIYNDRDCCADAEQCQHARLRVRENTINKISLNISPSYKPDSTSGAEAEQARTLKLAQSAIRSWRNREGEVVARGQFTNLKFGRVYIEHEGKLEKIAVGELSDDDWCFLAAWWGVPTECSLGDDRFEHREWLASTMTWKASGVCHKPLYFEEVQLERYGHTAGPLVQPVLSGAHFFLNIATLPYQMGISPPTECEYALGYYRPGSCAPWLLPPVPLSVRGALMEAGAITGGVFVIP